MENISTKGLENGGNLLQAMRNGLPVVTYRPAGRKIRQRTAAAAAAGDLRRAQGAAVAVAIRHTATYGFHLLRGAHLPEGRQRQQQGAEKRHPDQQATAPDAYHIFCI